jgi:hypothetical protein
MGDAERAVKILVVFADGESPQRRAQKHLDGLAVSRGHGSSGGSEHRSADNAEVLNDSVQDRQ